MEIRDLSAANDGPVEKTTFYSKAAVITSGIYFVFTYIINILTPEGSRLGGILLIALILLMYGFYTMHTRGNVYLHITYYHVCLLLFALYCMLSSLWAIRGRWALNKGIDMIEILIGMTMIYMIFQEKSDVKALLRMIMYGSYAVVLYALAYYGVSAVLTMLKTSQRVSNEAINANRLGLCAAYAMLINGYLILYDRVRVRDLLILPALLALFISGSRKAIIVLGAGAFALLVLRNWDKKEARESIVKIIAIIVVFAAAAILLLQLPAMALLKKRMADLLVALFSDNYDRSNSAWIRMEYNKLGLSLFKEHPLLGIGIGSANYYTQMYYGHDHFLHNNFIELLACGGLAGFCIYYSVYAIVLVRLIRYRNFRDPEYDICLVLFVLFMLMDYGMVSYLDKSTYIYMLLFWLESEKLKQGAKYEASSLRTV